MVEKKVCPRDFERNQQSSAKISADERYLIAAFGFKVGISDAKTRI
jgi:hypothetical protein